MSRSQPRSSNWARIEDLRPSRKCRIRTSSFGAAAGSGSLSTVCKCSRCAAQSTTSSNWYCESLRIVLQMLSTKALDSPRLRQRKALNSSQVIGTAVSLSIFRLCCCQRNRARSGGRWLQTEHGFVPWHRRWRNDLRTVDRSYNIPCGSYRGISPGTWLLKIFHESHLGIRVAGEPEREQEQEF